jgi:hypothetical protein
VKIIGVDLGAVLNAKLPIALNEESVGDVEIHIGRKEEPRQSQIATIEKRFTVDVESGIG